MDSVTIFEKMNEVFDNYERRRVDELLSPMKGNSRITTDQLQGKLGQAQACRELKRLLYTTFGFDT